MNRKFISVPPIALAALGVFAALMAWLAYHEWRMLNRPELSISAVYADGTHGYSRALVADYRNTGRGQMDWLEVKTALIDSGRLEETPPSFTVVRANPTPAGAARSIVLEVKGPPKAVALCARWLGPDKAMWSSQWYFVLDPKTSTQARTEYIDAVGDDRVSIANLQPCR